MTQDLSQRISDAFWEECQENSRRHEVKEEAIGSLLAACREIVEAEDADKLQEKLPSLVYYIRSAIDKLDDVL